MSTRTRTPERIEFLNDVLTTAIECGPYGWFTVEEYPQMLPENSYAVITDDGTGKTYHVDLDTIAKGLGVIRNAVLTEFDGEKVLANRKTRERLYFPGGGVRKELLAADRTNGDEGDYDVVGALAVLECALFGHVEYA